VRAVLDTNIVVSGLLWRAAPRQVLDAARDKRISLHTSSVLLDELAEVLSRSHLASVIAANRASPAFLMQRYAMLAQTVIPAQTARVVAKDIDDDAVIACALAAQADLIVSGDAHLLNLKSFHGMPIVTATEALARIGKVNPGH
jgi:putative PIN family toxin of toxin-antitoxin system